LGSAFANSLSSPTPTSTDYFVDPDCWEAFLVFTEVHDQWLFNAAGTPVALNGLMVMEWLRATQCDNIPKTYRAVRSLAEGARRALVERSHEQRPTS
jgi:hypothetical protein